MAHAILTPTSPYPRILVSRGHLLDSLGISVRYPPSAITKSRTYTELLPEEALYLLERGSLQIWLGRPAETTHEVAAGFGEWCEEELGVKGAIEMSVMEAFATFIGKDGLSWERYQVSELSFWIKASAAEREELIIGVLVFETTWIYSATGAALLASSFHVTDQCIWPSKYRHIGATVDPLAPLPNMVE